MIRKGLFVSPVAVLMLALALDAADDDKFSAICPVSGKAAKETSFVAYKGAKLYFCCDNCPKAFEKDSAKFAASANHQLVATGQAKQVKCPIKGKDFNPSLGVTIAGVKVGVCCPGCQKAASTPKGPVLLFSDAAFKKGFEVIKPKE